MTEQFNFNTEEMPIIKHPESLAAVPHHPSSICQTGPLPQRRKCNPRIAR